MLKSKKKQECCEFGPSQLTFQQCNGKVSLSHNIANFAMITVGGSTCITKYSLIQSITVTKSAVWCRVKTTGSTTNSADSR